ncbi:MAG: DEAD/DEAH box helicase [Muribaculaceae bacterium]|nr:DEAD/DEAH box helicase [Muribaculaceae bacterium]
MRFDEFDLSDEVLDALDSMGFSECTPIQEKAIPVILDGNDLIGVAQTGTGKTAAYLLPVISRLYDDGAPTDRINCVVMAPTRELVQQIDHQLEGFGYYLDLSSVAVYGGTDGPVFAQQQRGLKLGADVVVATPGRLLAHLQMGYVDLSSVRYFILDEADRMLDMGFYDDIMQVVKHLPADRHTLMFSATMPEKIRRLARNILRDPVEVRLAVSKPGENIDQNGVILHEAQKLPMLRHLFATINHRRVIVFTSSKIKCKEVARALRSARYNSASIHSDLSQNERDDVMLGFRAGRIDILVATDIVARGIDIDDITMVVNYDVPLDVEDYVHRIGRTARAGAEGCAVTFVGEREQPKFGDIENFLGYEIKKMTVPAELGPVPEYHPKRRSGGGQRRGGFRGGRPKNGRPSAPKNGCPAKGNASTSKKTNKPHAKKQHGYRPKPTDNVK